MLMSMPLDMRCLQQDMLSHALVGACIAALGLLLVAACASCSIWSRHEHAGIHASRRCSTCKFTKAQLIPSTLASLQAVQMKASATLGGLSPVGQAQRMLAQKTESQEAQKKAKRQTPRETKKPPLLQSQRNAAVHPNEPVAVMEEPAVTNHARVLSGVVAVVGAAVGELWVVASRVGGVGVWIIWHCTRSCLVVHQVLTRMMTRTLILTWRHLCRHPFPTHHHMSRHHRLSKGHLYT